MKFKKMFILATVVASMMVTAQSAFAERGKVVLCNRCVIVIN